MRELLLLLLVAAVVLVTVWAGLAAVVAVVVSWAVRYVGTRPSVHEPPSEPEPAPAVRPVIQSPAPWSYNSRHADWLARCERMQPLPHFADSRLRTAPYLPRSASDRTPRADQRHRAGEVIRWRLRHPESSPEKTVEIRVGGDR